jgi:uncharacterized protein
MDLFVPDGIRPREALRFAHIREQGFDRSCGYSVLASLLSIYWGIAASELELVDRYAADDIASGKLGVSFEGLAKILADYGFSSKGVRMTWDQLSVALESFAPIIVHYDRPDRHFALALSARKGWIILMDPALGCELLSEAQFMARWSGAALLAVSSSATRDDGLIEEAVRAASDRKGLLDRLGP